MKEEQNRAFLWTGELLAVLGRYAQDREHYPTMQPFMPHVVAFFNAAAAQVDQMLAARPKVVSLSIINGARNVDPALKEIVISFDRAMNPKNYTVVRSGALTQPKVGKISFDDTGRVLTLPVTLEPDKEYAFSLNWPGGGSFQSTDGVLLPAFEVVFRTRPVR